MTLAQRRALENHRRQLAVRGLIRLELLAQEKDRPLLREVARKLREEPEHAGALRAGLHRLLGTRPKLSRKAVLAAAPLEGIDLGRERDMGREVEL